MNILLAVVIIAFFLIIVLSAVTAAVPEQLSFGKQINVISVGIMVAVFVAFAYLIQAKPAQQQY